MIEKLRKNRIINKIIKLFLNREVIFYLIAGALTTLINIKVYDIACNRMGIQNLVANTIAWIIAVLFAYIVNDVFVFTGRNSRTSSRKSQFVKFFSARLFSFGVESLGMLILIDRLHFNNMVIKIAMCIIVVVMNYVFSKWFIFK